MKMPGWLIIGILLFGIMSAGYAKKLPELKLKDTNGKTVVTSEVSNQGKPIIISFFALWCKPCLRELTAINEVYEKWQKETGVKLIAVSIDDSRSTDKVLAEMNARGFDWEVWLDVNSAFKRAMNVNNIPHVFVIDGNGNIVWQHVSYTEGSEEEIIEVVRKLNAGQEIK